MAPFKSYYVKIHFRVRWLRDLIFSRMPFFKMFVLTRDTQVPIKFKMWFLQKVIGINRKAYWPVHVTSRVIGVKNILAGVETSPGYMPGCYIQGAGKIFIGDYTQIGPNVGIISANHDFHDNRLHIPGGKVEIGQYCWIGMNAMILPNVKLGAIFTIIGAGSVVTRSFVDGYNVIAGSPARVMKRLDRDHCIKYKSKFEFNGYIPSRKFSDFRKRNLSI